MPKHERRMINSFTYPLAFLLTCQPVSLKRCQLFSVIFNIMTVLLYTNRSPCRKKSILAKVCFDAKKGVASECSKMNIYLKMPPFAPVLGRFAAKWSAFWC